MNNLRYFSSLYFHGHSAGGTNPSLLEAMAASCLICAHDNGFNRSVLGEDGFYFKTEDDIAALINNSPEKASELNRIINNLNKLRDDYNMDKIVNAYFTLIEKTHKR